MVKSSRLGEDDYWYDEEVEEIEPEVEMTEEEEQLLWATSLVRHLLAETPELFDRLNVSDVKDFINVFAKDRESRKNNFLHSISGVEAAIKDTYAALSKVQNDAVEKRQIEWVKKRLEEKERN